MSLVFPCLRHVEATQAAEAGVRRVGDAFVFRVGHVSARLAHRLVRHHRCVHRGGGMRRRRVQTGKAQHRRPAGCKWQQGERVQGRHGSRGACSGRAKGDVEDSTPGDAEQKGCAQRRVHGATAPLWHCPYTAPFSFGLLPGQTLAGDQHSRFHMSMKVQRAASHWQCTCSTARMHASSSPAAHTWRSSLHFRRRCLPMRRSRRPPPTQRPALAQAAMLHPVALRAMRPPAGRFLAGAGGRGALRRQAGSSDAREGVDAGSERVAGAAGTG